MKNPDQLNTYLIYTPNHDLFEQLVHDIHQKQLYARMTNMLVYGVVVDIDEIQLMEFMLKYSLPSLTIEPCIPWADGMVNWENTIERDHDRTDRIQPANCRWLYELDDIEYTFIQRMISQSNNLMHPFYKYQHLYQDHEQ